MVGERLAICNEGVSLAHVTRISQSRGTPLGLLKKRPRAPPQPSYRPTSAYAGNRGKLLTPPPDAVTSPLSSSEAAHITVCSCSARTHAYSIVKIDKIQ